MHSPDPSSPDTQGPGDDNRSADDIDRFKRDLIVSGKSQQTIKAYLSYVRQLQRYHDGQRPSSLDEEQVGDWLASLRIEKQFKSGSLRVAHSAVKAFYKYTCPRSWSVLEHIHAPREQHLPEVLTREETCRLINRVQREEYRVCLWTIYSLGLRLSEGVNLQVDDIQAGRGVVHVRRGKGNVDRLVPLPSETLSMLRDYWRTHRHPRLVFPAGGRGTPGKRHANAESPVPIATIQGVWRKVIVDSGVTRKITVHTLRHSYATHCLEAGVNVRLLQKYLGHATLQHTVKYLHLTQFGQDEAHKAINRIMTLPTENTGHGGGSQQGGGS